MRAPTPLPGKSHRATRPSNLKAVLPNFLIAKLQWFTPLSDADRLALHGATAKRRQVGAREDIAHEGQAHGPVRMILDGWACRYRQLDDGRRQITAILLPGDLCDTHVNVLCEMDHSIGTITPVTLAEIARDRLDALVGSRPIVGRALWWEMLAAVSVQREWTVNIARREGIARLGHLFCELFHRLRAVGLTRDFGYGLPLRQSELADALGLTEVHVNRCLRALRDRDLITLRGRWLTILDLPALERASLFRPNYLHLGRRNAANAVGPVPARPPETYRYGSSHYQSAR